MTDRETDRQMDGWMEDRWMDGFTDRQIDGWMDGIGWIYRQTDRQTDRQT